MAVAFITASLVESEKTLDTTALVRLSAANTPGDLLVLAIVFDNAGTASKPVVSSITKQAGETNSWVSLGAARSTSTSIGAFASGELWAIKTSVTWATGAIYTVTLDTAVTMKATVIAVFSGVEATLRSTSGTAYSTTTTAASATTTGTTPVIGDLALGFLFGSNIAVAPAGDTDATAGSWSAAGGAIAPGSSGGSGATNNFGTVQYKVLTAATHQTYNSSATAAAGNGSIVAILQATPPPAITQAAYRLYEDGTETGSTALAAQDTAATADLTSGDVNLGLRVRLQETGSSATLAADDWQLQWEKNTDGKWTTVGSGFSVVDAYPDTNTATVTGVIGVGQFYGQAFLGDGSTLNRAGFQLFQAGTPPGNITATLYAHTGTYGTSGGTGTGSALASSTPRLCTSLTSTGSGLTDLRWEYFTFDGSFTLTNGTPYVIGVEVDGATAISNCPSIGVDNTSGTHPGSAPSRATGTGTWSASTITDRIFSAETSGETTVIAYASTNLTDAAATTSRLTGGTGTFTAGKISEDGTADNLGWATSNHTELLYSITLKQADLANGDTLKFRVLRNGNTTGLTYTQTPTINVTVGAAAYVPPHITTSNIAAVTRSYYY